MSSGDAKEVNAVTHMYTPWPPGVSDRRIVTDGAHMQRALERYRRSAEAQKRRSAEAQKRRSAEAPDPMPNVPLDYGLKFGPGLPPEQQGQGSATGAGAPSAYTGH
jgi:hypothetical protein